MNVVVIGEGRNELGKQYTHRNFLERVPENRLGAFEIIATRLAKIVFNRDLVVLGLPELPRTRPGNVQRASLSQCMQETDKLRQLLVPSFSPGKVGLIPAEGAIVVCDSDIGETVARAVAQIKHSSKRPVVQLTFHPEFEMVLFEKAAIEKAAGLPYCSVRIPSVARINASGAKEAFEDCVYTAGYSGNPPAGSGDFKCQVARYLSFGLTGENHEVIQCLESTLKGLF
jgi:hypothetical protein